MKKVFTNTFIRIKGFAKRIIRPLRIFLTYNKSKIKYTMIAIAVSLSLAVIVIVILNSDITFKDFIKPTMKPTEAAASTPLALPTTTPIANIYGSAPLVILDASEFEDNNYISQKALEFGAQNGIDGQYVKVSPSEFLNTYENMVKEGNTPNLVIASNDLIGAIGSFEDISSLHSEILFNNASSDAVKDDKIPIALEMYGYFFRVDLLFALSHEVPREYHQLENMANRLRSDFAYDYLKYEEESELLSDRADLFLTSRYGFGFPGDDIGGQLFIQQSISTQFEDGTNILHEVKRMWDESYLPPDTAYASDSNIITAYMNDGLVGVYSSGKLYERLYENSERYYGTQIKPFLGKEAVYTANVIYCAIPQGTNFEVATNFLSILYYGGILDKIIAQNHTAFLPISNFLNDGSPWKAALGEDSKMIYFEDDYYMQTIKQIILAGEDVESALSNSNK